MTLFRLVDPPPGQADMVRDVLAACDYPWHRIIPELRHDVDQAVVIRWEPNGTQATGIYLPDLKEIRIGTQFAGWEQQAPFVLAHELGHLVDYCTLLAPDRAAIKDDLHTARPMIGHIDHDHPDAGHTRDAWWTSEPYVSRVWEAFADAFVAAFCPTLFTNVRFVHWSGDLDRFRALVLARPIMAFSDVPEDHPHAEGINWAAAQGLIRGDMEGRFHPGDPVSRGQLCTILMRQADA